MAGARGSGGHGRSGPAKKDAAGSLQDVTADVSAPAGLHADAEEYWRYFAPLLKRRGILTESSRETLRSYCQLLVLRDRLESALVESQLVILSTSVDGAGNEHPKVQANPLLSHRRDTDKTLRSLANDLCLPPAAAMRMPAAGQGDEDDPLMAWAASGRTMRAVK